MKGKMAEKQWMHPSFDSGAVRDSAHCTTGSCRLEGAAD